MKSTTIDQQVQGMLANIEDQTTTCRIEGEFIRIRVPDTEHDIEIPLRRCDTHAKIIHWCMDLCDKSWMTRTVLSH